MAESETRELELHRLPPVTRALVVLAVSWTLALGTIVAALVYDVPIMLPVIACGVVIAVDIEVARHASSVIASKSWSRPAGALEVSRALRGVALTVVLLFALIPVIGALAAFGFQSATAQVDSPRSSYTYRVEYGALRPALQRIVVVLSAQSSIAAAIALANW